MDITAAVAGGRIRAADKKGAAAASNVGVLRIAGAAWTGAGSVVDG